MNIRVLILACRNAMIKSSCFTWALILLACPRNISRQQNEVVGDHLSSVMFLSCKSPRTTNCAFSLSKDLSLMTLTLKVSITGVLISPSFSTNVPASIRVFSSFLSAFLELFLAPAPRNLHLQLLAGCLSGP
jgi:hypothetical protein